MKVALNRPGKFFRSNQSRSNLPLKYTDPRRYFASQTTEIFFTSQQTAFLNDQLADDNLWQTPGLT